MWEQYIVFHPDMTFRMAVVYCVKNIKYLYPAAHTSLYYIVLPSTLM